MESVSTSPAIISLQKVGLSFGSNRVLHDISFDIPKGQTVVVIGESGCGKTVLLKLLIALIRPTMGNVYFDGKILANLSDSELAKQRLRFGFLFQGAALFDSMSVFDNIAFGMREQRKLSEANIREQVLERLKQVGLPPAAETKKPAELSGGMKKRVGLARALALNPEIMLYDEPTTGLDPIMTDVINELIIQARTQNPMTSIVVTHEMKTVLKVADRVIMFQPLSRDPEGKGQIVFDGDIPGLLGSPDPRVRQFIQGEAGDRIKELASM